MQVLLVMLIIIVATYGLNETMLNSKVDKANLAISQASGVAYNILAYNNLLTEYMQVNYDKLNNYDALNPGHVENYSVIDYDRDSVGGYSSIKFSWFLDYKTIAFDYTAESATRDSQEPTLNYMTSWNSFQTSSIHGFKTTGMAEILGVVNQLITKRIYQGNSTYWSIPWVFSQENCNITEMFTQLPRDLYGNSQINDIKELFNHMCIELQNQDSYTLGKYVYWSTIIRQDS